MDEIEEDDDWGQVCFFWFLFEIGFWACGNCVKFCEKPFLCRFVMGEHLSGMKKREQSFAGQQKNKGDFFTWYWEVSKNCGDIFYF